MNPANSHRWHLPWRNDRVKPAAALARADDDLRFGAVAGRRNGGDVAAVGEAGIAGAEARNDVRAVPRSDRRANPATRFHEGFPTMGHGPNGPGERAERRVKVTGSQGYAIKCRARL